MRVGIGYPALQPVAFDRELDAETVGLEEIAQTRGDLAEQFITSEMAADGPIDVEQRLPFGIENLQQILGALPLRHVARDGEQLLGRTCVIADRGDRDVPPLGCVALSGREKSDEAADLTAARGLDCPSGGGAIRTLPEIDPRRADERREVAHFQLLHTASVHRQQPPIEIQHLDAVVAAIDQPGHELDARRLCVGAFRAGL
jgi:hypothetical protein